MTCSCEVRIIQTFVLTIPAPTSTHLPRSPHTLPTRFDSSPLLFLADSLLAGCSADLSPPRHPRQTLSPSFRSSEHHLSRRQTRLPVHADHQRWLLRHLRLTCLGNQPSTMGTRIPRPTGVQTPSPSPTAGLNLSGGMVRAPGLV